MVESIYYVKRGELPAFLDRMTEMLDQGGIFVFRLHELEKHREYIETVVRLYPHTQRIGEYLFGICSRVPGDDQRGVNLARLAAN